LTGYDIPGVSDKILATLFTDDTTIYLPRGNRLSELQQILDTWCTASGAKFNTDKTEIIPIGSMEHRQTVITSRRLHPGDDPIPISVHIAKDGETVRSLGAWIGNGIDALSTWEIILDKVDLTLKRLGRGHPTLNSKRHMVQHIAGGMTQYLTKVQGMPKSVEAALTKVIRCFIWDGATQSPLALEHLYLDMSEG
ncbi:hypothetical protein GLOTRDRAFT_24514, partial [Gloeophyllum trabeum ATCC 11539]